jgi:hypothetical protein
MMRMMEAVGRKMMMMTKRTISKEMLSLADRLVLTRKVEILPLKETRIPLESKPTNET